MNDYTPIDCNFYDELVLLSMRKTPIVFVPNKFDVEVGDFIKDLVTKPSKEEFMILNSGIEIRLDQITTASENILFLAADEDFLSMSDDTEDEGGGQSRVPHILTYTFVENYLELRTPHRQSHFEYLQPYADSKLLLLGGATADPADKGVLIFDQMSIAEIEEFVKGDPYFSNGLIQEYSIQQWNIVIGSLYQQTSS